MSKRTNAKGYDTQRPWLPIETYKWVLLVLLVIILVFLLVDLPRSVIAIIVLATIGIAARVLVGRKM